jgi:hypothetical protein
VLRSLSALVGGDRGSASFVSINSSSPIMIDPTEQQTILQVLSLVLGLLGALLSSSEILFPFEGQTYEELVSEEVEAAKPQDFIMTSSFGRPIMAFKRFPEPTAKFMKWDKKRRQSLMAGLVLVILSAFMQGLQFIRYK